MIIAKAEQYLGIGVDGKLLIMDYYNDNCYQLVSRNRRYKMKPNDNWCACFTSVIAHKCGLSYDQFPYEVSVGEQVKLAKARGTYYQNVELVKVGDLIIYDWNGDKWPDHVGFVSQVMGGTIVAIEGNYNKTVGYRSVKKSSNSIMGFVRL